MKKFKIIFVVALLESLALFFLWILIISGQGRMAPSKPIVPLDNFYQSVALLLFLNISMFFLFFTDKESRLYNRLGFVGLTILRFIVFQPVILILLYFLIELNPAIAKMAHENLIISYSIGWIFLNGVLYFNKFYSVD